VEECIYVNYVYVPHTDKADSVAEAEHKKAERIKEDFDNCFTE
jgi:hypothetical protein